MDNDLPKTEKWSAHLQAHNQHLETIQKFKATYSRPLSEETKEALEWIHHSKTEELVASELGHSTPWEHLHPNLPGPFLSLGAHLWVLIIGNDNYLSVPALGGCINDAHLVNDYVKKYLQVPEDHIVLLENACHDEMVDALYNLRDNKTIPFGDNILIYYSGYGSAYNYTQGQWTLCVGAICPTNRGCGACDISERELDFILSELCAAKGPKVTFISDCCYSGSSLRSVREDAVFRVVPPLRDEYGADDLDHMLKLAMDNPRRCSNIDIFSKNWKRELASYVQLEPGGSTIEMGVGPGNRRHGLFTFAIIKVLESEEGRGATYEGVIQLIGHLRKSQMPKAIGISKDSLLWFTQ